MDVLGVLLAIRPDDEAVPGKVGPRPPGDSSVPVLAIAESASEAKARTKLTEIIHAEAERSRDRALRLVDSVRTSTTLAALAQTHATLGETKLAVAAAREALDLSLSMSENGTAMWGDTSSAQIAAEILLHLSEPEYAYEALRRAPMTESLSITFMFVASALGKCDEAKEAFAPYDSAVVAASRGYLLTCMGEFREAIADLRYAVRENPGDSDSLLNLAISLWNIGATRKATNTALRATRSAPGRKDISLLYMELLLAGKDVDRLSREIAMLKARKIIPDAKFFEVQARTLILKGERPKAVNVLSSATEAAKREGDRETEGRTRANLVRFKHALGRMDRTRASQELAELISQFPGNDAVVVNFAEVARKRHEAAVLRKALPQLENNTTEIRLAYLRHQIAFLEGNVDAAGAAAAEWFRLEPNNVMAAIAAVVSIGIGQGRWDEAVVVAEYALHKFPTDLSLINNAAYVLAMSNRAEEAIRLLEPIAADNFVLNATLGLAYLAHGDVKKGMRLYRDAAILAEKVDSVARSALGLYQALVVRQLGLNNDLPEQTIAALSPIPVDLPADWRDRPDFLRLQAICVREGYSWPLSV